MPPPGKWVNGRSVPTSMGKVLGGGSSINTMIWAWGHRNDWEFYAAQSGDPAWGYESVIDIDRRIEDWHGAPDPEYRGTGRPVFVQTAPDPHPIAYAAAPNTGVNAAAPTARPPHRRAFDADTTPADATCEIDNPSLITANTA